MTDERQARHIWIAIPAYTGTIHLGTMRSLIADMLAFADRGDRVTIFDESGNAMIGDCRGLIVAKFLDSDATDLVFIDSDVVWEAGALLKLVDQPVQFAAGIYPQRKDPLNFCVRRLEGANWADPKTKLLEVQGVPAGCIRLRRHMLEQMVEAYPETDFYCPDAPNDTVWDLFGAFRDPRDRRIKYGEDYSFCERWRALGGRIWVDPEMRMGHVGFKTFTGSWGDWLRAQPAYQAAQIEKLNRQLDEVEQA